MKAFSLLSSSIFCLCILLSLCFPGGVLSAKKVSLSTLPLANIPPRGWNSYDSFSWTINEQEFLQNAQIVSKRLRVHGYEYVVVDYLWYRKKVPGAHHDSLGFDVIDEWGKMVPDPGRWPSSQDGSGFTKIADQVHNMGLKFGIHVMKGISTQAVNANTPIQDPITGRAYEESGRVWHAKDIVIPGKVCAWMPHGFMSVNTTLGAGRAFLMSLYLQYYAWGVDFVKHDCAFGDDFDLNEIRLVSEVLQKLDRPIVYSLSPGTSVTPALAKQVVGLANMYRITQDDWDNWPDVKSHFDVIRDLAAANLIGEKGLKGKSWPDLDMLPFGWLTEPAASEGPHRNSNLTLDEKRTQMTLWSMAKSPLMYGGDVRNIDPPTFDLITNPTLLKINAFSSNNVEFPYVISHGKAQGNGSITETKTLGLTNCSDSKAIGWKSEGLDQYREKICWNGGSSGNNSPFCVHKRELNIPSSDKENIHQVKHHLVATNRVKACMDASPKQDSKKDTFSPCRLDNSNQMWELNPNGTLLNVNAGLCATIESVKVTVIPGGARSWVATGSKGEVYVAFFNLSEQKAEISMQTSDLAKVLHGRNFNVCKGTEVWSGRKVVAKQGPLSAEVESHGTALFVLHCK